MKVDFERGALVEALEREFATAGIVLGDIPVGCSWPVFSATIPSRGRIFVKLGSKTQIRRMYSFLARAGECRLFPRTLTSAPIAFGDHLVACLSWQSGVRVDAESMTPEQTVGFARGCLELSERLQRAEDVVMAAESEESPDRLADVFAEYSSRHRMVARMLRPLAAVANGVRGFAGLRTGVIHGDFQPRNYGFEGNEMSAVFDFDDLTESLRCADAAYAFVERARRSGLCSGDRHRLMSNFREVMRQTPWKREEWLTAIGIFRLRIAERRLVKHMGSPMVALDVARRDRLLEAFCAEI